MKKYFFHIAILLAMLLSGAQSTMASKPVVTVTDPQIGAGLSIAWGNYANMSFTLTFDQNVSVVNAEPDIKLYEGDTNGSVISPDDVWKANSAGANKVMIFGADYDGFTCAFQYNSEKEYTLVIPANMVKNSDGEMNDEIVLVYNSQQPGPGTFELVNSTPADGAVLTGSYNYAAASFTLTFGENVVIKNNAPAITFTKDGAAVSDVEEWHLTTGSNAVDALVWGSDMDGYTASFRIDENATYTLTVPAGVIANGAGDLNEEIVLTFYGSDKAAGHIVNLVSSDPAEDGLFQKAWGTQVYAQFDLTFDSNVTLENNVVKDIKLYQGEVGGTEVTPEWDGGWSANINSNKTLHIFSLDEYGEGVMTFTPQADTKYYLVVPAKIVKNADGWFNEKITISINGSEPHESGTFELVSSDPADEAVLTGSYGYAAASFTLTFGENVVIKNNAPAITFTKDGAAVSDVEEWHLTTGSNAVDALVWGSDMDGYTASFRIDENATYTLTVPAGVIANAAGDLNEEIVLTFYGSDKAKYGTLDFVSSNPENEGTFNLNAQGMTFVTFDLTFSDAVKINSQAIVNEVKLYEGELNGTEIEPEFGNWSASMSSDKKTLSIFSLDEYGEGLMMMRPKEETKYYLVVPANIVVTDKNLGNEAITIVINGPEKQEPEQESVTSDPMDKSTIGTLNNIVITFETTETVTSNANAGNINVYSKNSDVVLTTATVVADEALNGNQIKLALAQPITTNGIYIVKVPAGYFLKGDKPCLAFELTYKVDSVLGINDATTIIGKKVMQRMTVDGKVIDQPVKGVNILKLSDGTIVKVLVK